MHLHLDPVGGIAGDMFVASLLDAFPNLAEGLLAAVRHASLPLVVNCRIVAHRDHALTGRKFEVDDPYARRRLLSLPGAQQGARHVPFAEIRERLASSSLGEGVKVHAIGIFTVLARAEAKVHGTDVDAVAFHEVGAWDSIADIVGAAYLIDALGDASWSSGPLPMGSGLVATAHGLLPVPTPATALLLEGFTLRNDRHGGERVTPTGAAILRYLDCRDRPDGRPRKLLTSGIGFGTRVFPGMSNILRVLVLENAQASVPSDELDVLAFEVDVRSPEDLAAGTDTLRRVTPGS